MREYLAHIPSRIYIIDHLSQYQAFGEAGDVLQGKIRYDPSIELTKGIPPPDPRAKLEEIAKKFHHISNTTLIIEEAELYLPQGRAIPPWTQSLIQAGRNWGCGIYLNTRRIQRLDKSFFDLCQAVFFFRCGLKSREYISDLIGKDYVVKPSRSAYNTLKYGITTLPPYHFLYFDLESEETEIGVLKLGVGGIKTVENPNIKSQGSF
jgi:hypothetical protein